MDDAFIMNTTFLDSFFPPFLSNRRGQVGPLASPPVYCRFCGSRLIEQPVGNYIRLACDKVGCPLFRESQGIVPRGKPTTTQQKKARDEVPQCRVCGRELKNGQWPSYLKKTHSRICRRCYSEQRTSNPSYQPELARRRETYRFAKSLGIPTVLASKLLYKSKEYIEQIARQHGAMNPNRKTQCTPPIIEKNRKETK